MNKKTKSPFKANFYIFSIISFLTGIYLLIAALNPVIVYYVSDYAINIFTDIIIGIFTSSLLLLAIEIISYRRDKRNLGFLEGKYKKILITGINDGKIRTPNPLPSEMKTIEKGSNIKFIQDSLYHELCYYELEKNEYHTHLVYEYNGKYSGEVEYLDYNLDHTSMNPKPKCKTLISLVLNSQNTGSGSYKYKNKNDLGIYNIQLDPENSTKIWVFYQNVVPSGLAEGYEVWQKID